MSLPQPAPPHKDPPHIAIIMDGNGRWAARRNMDRLKGHYAGVKVFKQIVKASLDLQVKYLTVFAFSTENWKRSAGEVTGLMTLFRRHIRSEAAELFEHGVRVRFIGQRGRLDARLVALMEGLEAQTAGNTRMHLTVAVDYGGRDEIVRTARELAGQVRDGLVRAEDIDEAMFADNMDTAGLPDPDLVLRTSGECRTSNFLPWQSIYAEYVFDEAYWPDYTEQQFRDLVYQFYGRERRFGAVVAGD